jgi:hypothetical protein
MKKLIKKTTKKEMAVNTNKPIPPIWFGERLPENEEKEIANKISEIKNRYKFHSDFDLSNELVKLRTNIPSLAAHIKSFPRPAEIKKKIIKLKKASDVLLKILQDTHINIKVLLNEAQSEYTSKDKMNCENPNWKIHQFLKDLNIFNTICSFALPKIPEDRGGRNTSSKLKTIILFLASIYERGTGKCPICNWTKGQNSYVGNFYDFLLDVAEPYIRHLLGFKTEWNYRTLGKYTVKTLQDYKNHFQ